MRINLPIIIIVVLLVGLAAIFFAPLNLYLKIYSRIYSQAILLDGQPISWQIFRDELNLVSLDKNLKTRGQRIEAAINQAVTRQILKQALGKEAESFSSLTPYDQLKQLKNKIVEKDVNRRSGGYFIASFTTAPPSSGSALPLKDQAKAEITKLKVRLDQGESFQKVLSDAKKNTTLNYLNGAAFSPGIYLKDATADLFPLHIKSFRDQFFSMTAPSVSDILTLSWDGYDGPTLDKNRKIGGEFAYALIKIDEANLQSSGTYTAWLSEQKKKAKIKTFMIPFFFSWF